MELNELLSAHREYYINHFNDFLTKSEKGASELLLEIKNEEPEELFRLYRYDLVYTINDEHNIAEFNTDGFLKHDEISYSAGHKTLYILPIAWNGIEIWVDMFSQFDSLKNWVNKWIDLNDINEPDENGFLGVIHNITKPTKDKKDNITFSVDLGTAPIESAIELINILLEDKTTSEIRLESKWLTG